MPKALSDDFVRTIRERAWRGEDPVALAEEYELRTRVVRRMIRGETHKNAGGPIAESVRRRGERRLCTRCRLHKDESDFIFIRDSRTGICAKCEKPEDKFLKMNDRVKRSLDIRRKHNDRRSQLIAEIEMISRQPLIDVALVPTDEERARIFNDVMRQKFPV